MIARVKVELEATYGRVEVELEERFSLAPDVVGLAERAARRAVAATQDERMVSIALEFHPEAVQ